MPKLLKPEAFYEKASDEAVRTSCKPFPVEHILNLYQHYSLLKKSRAMSVARVANFTA